MCFLFDMIKLKCYSQKYREGYIIIMVFGQLEHLLIEQGFEKVSSNLPEFSFFFRRESTYANVLYVIDFKPGLYITQDQYWHIREKIKDFFNIKGINNIHILSLLISSDPEQAKQLCVNDPFCWLIDPTGNRLLIYEHQVTDFYGIKGVLEKFLFDISVSNSGETVNQDIENNINIDQNGQHANMPWMNIILVSVNVILYIVCTITGDLLYNIGTFGVMDLIENREWYRFFTCMFLHADIQHLISNMLILYYIGNVVERHIGHISYIIIYFLSGLAGNVLSAGYELFTGSYISSLGASGAVFGIEGAMLMLAILNKGRITEITAGRLAFAISFSLYCGFTSSYVNNMAHIGGVLMGFAAVGVFWLLSGLGEKYNN